ncbi:MAG TPA: ATP-binding protein [Fulvivirga sp.]|nr:ATP-binding protein [Fulvivirga sp.]
MKYSYKVPCKKEKLRDIRSFLKQILDKHGLSEIDASTLVLAIDEVCANLIIHSHNCNAKESIELEVVVKGDSGIIFNIIDKSEIFDISEYVEPKLEDIIKKQRKGGLGLILVKRIMDDIEIIREPHKNICRLTKNIKVI